MVRARGQASAPAAAPPPPQVPFNGNSPDVPPEVSFDNRTILATYIGGGDGAEHRSAGQRLRYHVTQSLAGESDAFMQGTCQGCAGQLSHRDAMRVYQSSTFCLVLAGDAPSSRRATEVVLHGCLPVYLGPPYNRCGPAGPRLPGASHAAKQYCLCAPLSAPCPPWQPLNAAARVLPAFSRRSCGHVVKDAPPSALLPAPLPQCSQRSVRLCAGLQQVQPGGARQRHLGLGRDAHPPAAGGAVDLGGWPAHPHHRRHVTAAARAALNQQGEGLGDAGGAAASAPCLPVEDGAQPRGASGRRHRPAPHAALLSDGRSRADALSLPRVASSIAVTQTLNTQKQASPFAAHRLVLLNS